jgi:opacity protein-like surface antigen
MNIAIKLGLVSLVLCSNSQLINATPGAYFGGGAGIGRLAPEEGLNKREENVLGGRVFFGYNLNNYLGLEANYAALNKTHYYDLNYPLITGDYSLNALSLVGKLYLPLPQSPVNLYVLLGAAQLLGNFDVTYQSRSLVNVSTNAIVPTAGVGVSYNLNHSLIANLEVSGFGKKQPFDDLDIPQSMLATLSLAYQFNT